MVCERFGDVVFMGSRSALDRIREGRPAARPELAKAFAAAGDAAIRVVLVPTADSRRVVEEMLPMLPEQIGGGPTTAITRGVLWVAAGIEMKPDLLLRMRVQSESAEAAKALDGVIGRILERARQEIGKEIAIPDLDRTLAVLRPRPDGDHLTLELDAQTFATALVRTLGPLLMQTRQMAKRTVSMANMKGIMTALYTWATDHKDEWPKNLQVLVDAKSITPEVLVNPAQPNRKPAYVYVRPSVPLKKVDPQALVMYEAHDAWGEGINVAFADGHVEFMKDQAKFKELLAKATSQPAGTK
jgi:prepilin-type processing-associated H-X9-DG protein